MKIITQTPFLHHIEKDHERHMKRMIYKNKGINTQVCVTFNLFYVMAFMENIKASTMNFHMFNVSRVQVWQNVEFNVPRKQIMLNTDYK